MDKTFKIAFFNVGAGNCTIAKFPGNHVWIIDAGSRHFPVNALEYSTKDQIKESTLVSSIKSWIEQTDKKYHHPQTLHFVISHLDQDHYNLIKPILLTYMDVNGFYKTKIFFLYQ